MKRSIIFLICLGILHVCSFAQILQKTTDNKRLRVVMPSNYPSMVATTGIRSVIFLEYGDGGFTNNPATLPHGYKPSASYRALIHSVVLYDTIKRPPMRSARTLSFPNAGQGQSVLITDSKRIVLTPSSSDVVPDEDMVFALTYRLPLGVKGILGVSYDENLSNAFVPMNSVSELTTYDGTDIEAIRVHHGEEPAVDAGAKKITFSTQASIGDSVENNVFFNLKTNKVGVINGATNKATINFTITAPGIFESYSLNLVIRFSDGHDPNYLVSLPDCIEYPVADQKVNYTIHFENTGSGPVRTAIIAEVQLPDGIDYNNIVITNIKLGQSYNVGSNFTVGPIPTITRRNGLIIIHRVLNRRLILRIIEDGSAITRNKHLLDGNYPSGVVSYDSRFGEIKFRTVTTTMANRFLIAWASVKFDALSPVITSPSFSYFSKKCPSDCFYYK